MRRNRNTHSYGPALPPAAAVADVYHAVHEAVILANRHAATPQNHVTVALRELSTASSNRGFYGPSGPQTSHAQRESTQQHTSYAETTAFALKTLNQRNPQLLHANATQQAAIDMLLTHNIDIVCLLTTHDPVFVEAQQSMSIFLASGNPTFAAFLDFFLTICANTRDAHIASLAERVRGTKCNFCYCIMHRFRTVSAFAIFQSMRALWRRLNGAPAAGPYATFTPNPHNEAPAAAAAAADHPQSSVQLLVVDVTRQPESVHSAMRILSTWRSEDDDDAWRTCAKPLPSDDTSSPSSYLVAIKLICDSDTTQTLLQCIEEREISQQTNKHTYEEVTASDFV